MIGTRLAAIVGVTILLLIGAAHSQTLHTTKDGWNIQSGNDAFDDTALVYA